MNPDEDEVNGNVEGANVSRPQPTKAAAGRKRKAASPARTARSPRAAKTARPRARKTTR